MVSKGKARSEKKKVAASAGFDRGPRDWFRGSRGIVKGKTTFGSGRSFMGFRRGSRESIMVRIMKQEFRIKYICCFVRLK